DISVCMSCQICVEVCPFDAIKMDQVYELSRFDRFDDLLLKKRDLAKSNDYYHSIHPTEATEVDDRLTAEKAKAEAARAKAATPASAAPSPSAKSADSAPAPAKLAAGPAPASSTSAPPQPSPATAASVIPAAKPVASAPIPPENP